LAWVTTAALWKKHTSETKHPFLGPKKLGKEFFNAVEVTRYQRRKRTGTVSDMAVDLAGDMGKVALDSAKFRAIQGAARDETKEIKEGGLWKRW
jgi:hypothetical protein